MRILVLGAGVIGSVYAGRLLQARHEVVLLARGRRLAELRNDGLVLDDAGSDRRSVLPVRAVDSPPVGVRFDLVLVTVRAEQLAGALPVLAGMDHRTDVAFFGNTAGRQSELLGALGSSAFFGFPAVGGVREASAVRYLVIRQQRTMLGEPDGATTARVRRLGAALADAGFRPRVSRDIGAWLSAHAAFVVPIAVALRRAGTDPRRLAADRYLLRLTVAATRQAFAALQAVGNGEIPTNLRVLYRLPTAPVAGYWRRVLQGPRGELWFAAHTRSAPAEIELLADELWATVRRTGRPAPALDRLLAGGPP